MEFISIFEEIDIAKKNLEKHKNICDELNHEYKNIIKKIQEYSKSYKTKDLYEKYMDRLERCKYEIDQEKSTYWCWKSIFDKNTSLLSMLSKFDCEKIGPVIAKLISTIEDKEYIYHKAIYTEKEVISDRCGIDDDYDDYNAFMITLKSNVKNHYEEIKGKSSFISGSVNIILKLNNRFGSNETDVNFYDKEGNETINTKAFDYVYEFINFIIKEKLKNKTTKISDEGLYEMLDTFLGTYGINDPDIKKRK